VDIIPVIETAAVIASAIYGVLLAARKNLDIVGVFAVAFIISFGGGTLRDLALDRHPLFWIANHHYVWIVLGLSLLGAMIPSHLQKLEKYLLVPDAVGLALFTITGTAYALATDPPVNLLIAVILGVVTGTFGGVLADIICNEIPSLFREAPLYATAAFVGAWVYALLVLWAWSEELAAGAAFVTVFAIRIAAVRWNIRLPNARLG
jgi:uncharacterized membrane protein YeiH